MLVCRFFRLTGARPGCRIPQLALEWFAIEQWLHHFEPAAISLSTSGHAPDSATCEVDLHCEQVPCSRAAILALSDMIRCAFTWIGVAGAGVHAVA